MANTKAEGGGLCQLGDEMATVVGGPEGVTVIGHRPFRVVDLDR
ncbi:hypothetical protein [Streptomyces gilvosporeus]